MGVAVLPYPNDAAFTDGDWTDDFEFYIGSLATPDVFASTDAADASFVSQLAGAFQLSTAAGTLELVNGNTWRIRAPKSLMQTIKAGTYLAELRRLGADGSVEPLLVWRQPVIAGASSLAFAPNNPLPPGGGTSDVLQIIQGDDMQIIRSGGRQGWSALDVLINAGLLPAGSSANDFAAYLAALGGGSGVGSRITTLTPVSGDVALQASGASSFALTLTENVTFTLSTTVKAGNYATALVAITQGGTGSYTITLPSNVRWQGAYQTGLSTAVGATDLLQLITMDGGTTWLAAIVGNFAPA